MIYILLGLTAVMLTMMIIVIILLLNPRKNEGIIRDEFSAQRRDNLNQLQQNREELAGSIARFSASIDAKMETQSRLISSRLYEIEQRNEKSIEQIRKTVDENLDKTLSEHIGQSFKAVSDRLEQVNRGIGEMHSIAESVGDLKKVLSNVKNRGVWGELQLDRLLSQMLSTEQYEKNFAAKPGSGSSVEFAVKIPSGDNILYLPIDSKFPIESYTRLLDAYDNNPDMAEKYAKELEDAIKKSAKDISEKYINPPLTTDYALMFLPIEGLYCEAVRRDGMIEQLQQKYRVIISGPTTLTALLSSLQAAFRSAALEKKAAEVSVALSDIKSEFEKFESTLSDAQKNLQRTSSDLDKLIGARTRSIIKKLDSFERTESE